LVCGSLERGLECFFYSQLRDDLLGIEGVGNVYSNGRYLSLLL